MTQWQDTAKKCLDEKNDEIEGLRKELTSKQTENERLKKEISEKETLIQDIFEEMERLNKRNDETMNQLQRMQDEVEVHQKRFQQEREAREKLVTEKENILSESELLVLSNKQFIDEARFNNENPPDAPPTPTAPPASNGASRESISASPELENQKIRYICPICNCELPTLRLLEQHIDICLKDLKNLP